MTVFRARRALLADTITDNVEIRCVDGMITAIEPFAGPVSPDVEVLPGLVLPGFADAHSHAFHRALRGRTHGRGTTGGSFWTWREQMYALAARLDPDTLAELARAVFVEMVCAGVTAVGEFHYLHHGPGGVRYADPNELGLRLLGAGAEAGLAITLLDTAYLAGGFGQPLAPVQQRFSDGTGAQWAERVAALPAGARVGVAIHSVRAVPEADLTLVAAAAGDRPLHVHLSEQPAENDDCLAATGRTPTRLLADHGAIGPRTAAVHATHLTDEDIEILGAAQSFAVLCPTTEADLADGLPRAVALARAGARLATGSDQHVVIDPFAQIRELEYGQRLATGVRGHFSPAQLIQAGTAIAHAAIGSPAGRIEVGAPADLVAVRTDTARTAGAVDEQVVMAASAADVAVVVVGGRVQARDGVHVRWGAPGALLTSAIERAWAQ